MDLRVRLMNDAGSVVAEVVNRDDFAGWLQQELAGKAHQENGPVFKPYAPEEPQYSENPPPVDLRVEHLKSEFTGGQRERIRSVSRIPRTIPIPAGALEHGFTSDVVRGELYKLLPICRELHVNVAIVS